MAKTIADQVHEIIFDLLPSIDDAPDGARLGADLGMDSLDEVELVMLCEERWGIVIPDEDAEAHCSAHATVADVAKCVERHVAAKRAATA